jgi:peptidoglycan/xylan/chitin deacetylase (PgdA/CDA1 family)
MTLLTSVARAALHRAGGLRLVRRLHRGGLRILMFHRFGPPRPDLRETLERRCRHLRDCYQPISLTDAARAWRDRRPLPPGALAVTVDDGYRDFYELAYPVFSRFEIPVTVYLVTDFLDGRCWLWFDRLRSALAQAAGLPSTPAEIEVPGAGRLPLSFEPLKEALKRVPNAARTAFLERLPAALGIQLPPEPPASCAPMTWEWAREMAANGIDFGAHTRTHPILSRVEDPAALREEIEGSRRRIEQALGRPVRHFCYPNGRPEDISETVVECVRRAGFETAVVTDPGFNPPPVDPFRLQRIPADPTYPDLYFEECVAGLH